ncbi:MAG: DEAD/DEAH box helicase [Myxococcota bacterium]
MGALDFAHPCTRRWFGAAFPEPTLAQKKGWPSIWSGSSTLLLAPTGSGKTLAAFLVAIDRLAFGDRAKKRGVRVLYVTPLKALGVDVERNLRAPLAGIRAVAARDEFSMHDIKVGIRSGDTPPKDRQRMLRHPPDVLITTPESLYLMLTSRAAEILASVETVIIDEIHSVVATKRGAHLALSLERLEAITPKPIQRIGLSATQRPLDEVACFLGGFDAEGPRPVEIVDAGYHKEFDIRIEVPVEDMARLDAEEEPDPFDLDDEIEPKRVSIWPAIHPRLVELIRAHRSTMIFVNSRRLAERLAGAINELAEEELALAHHGSIAKDIRAEIEDRLKRGDLPAMVATSSLELGIDIGAVDLVIQIEAPPSVASGIQRIGRAGHQVGAVSRGRIFPKYRHDLLACAAVTQHVHEGRVEATYYPRNPLDVLAQQIVAMTVQEPELSIDTLYARTTSAAPFRELPRRSFEGVLDMLSGRYPSESFGDLRPRITWDRIEAKVTPRKGARMLAIANAGTIPDRGLYGVFLAHSEKPVRVGELDEEMVFESREGEVFLLGASSWRIEEITHDRVLVTPAPGQPGKMPFWHGDRPGRPVEFGRAIGALSRTLVALEPAAAVEKLVAHHGLDTQAADNLVRYLHDQKAATGVVPSDKRIVLERFIDEIGDWCITVLTPFGATVHAPWVTAVTAQLLKERGLDADAIWSDDGMVFRLPEADEPPDENLFFPDPEEIERLVTGRLGETALFAARFRENAGRALLLPRRRPGKRQPLWAQRRKSSQLLNVASGFRDFPIILETYRECLKDVFDLPALTQLLKEIRDRQVRVDVVDTRMASPFASALLFNYVSNFMYEGDAPLAERRAQALTLDYAQLRELLGEPELRELLDAEAVREVEARLQKRVYPLKDVDDLHATLLSIGDLSPDEIAARYEGDAAEAIDALVTSRRVITVPIGGEVRAIAVEDAARYRDALGVVPPPGLPQALLDLVEDALGELVARYARTHVPFSAEEVAQRFGVGVAPVRSVLQRLVENGRLVEGELLPAEILRERGRRGGREYCDADVLKQIKRRSLAKLRAEVEPVDPSAFARFALTWHGVGSDRRGADALLTVVEQLQGAPLTASTLESLTLPSRLSSFDARDLDELCAAGEVIWRGVQALGGKDGRIALYTADHYALLAGPAEPAEGDVPGLLRELLAERGALFFRDLVSLSKRISTEVFEALWDLVWAGEVTNDTLAPLRGLRAPTRTHRGRRAPRRGPPGSEGRWSLLPPLDLSNPTQRLRQQTTQLLARHGVLVREVASAENIEGGFSAIYPVLKTMEEMARARRGYFVAGLGATQFALPGCEDRLRDHREPSEGSAAVVLAADDPANPYGASLPWPNANPGGPSLRAARAAGAQVVLFEGHLVAYLGKTGERLSTYLPETEPDRGRAGRALALALAEGIGRPRGRRGGKGVVIARIDDQSAAAAPFAEFLRDVGFRQSGQGLFRRVGAP